MSRRRAVITGLGVIAGSCCGVEQLEAALVERRMLTTVVDRAAGYHRDGSPRCAMLSQDVDLSRWVSAAESRRMSHASKFAVAATRMALADAGLTTPIAQPNTVVMSTAFGAVTTTERIMLEMLRDGPETVSPFDFTESVANAPAAHMAVAAGAHGPNITIVQREAGALTAIGRAAEEVASGRADIALAGAVDDMPPVLHALLGRFDALARPDDAGVEVARPFDRSRNGFIAAEGAAVTVIEPEDHAIARAQRPWARVRGFRNAFDPRAPRTGWGRDHRRLAARLRTLLDDANLSTRDVDRIVSGGSGSIAGDRLEAEILSSVWQDAGLPPTLAPKGVVGEYGGGFIAAALLSMRQTEVPAAAGYLEMDPLLGIEPHRGGVLPPARSVVVTTTGSGGVATWLLLENIT